MESLLFWRRDRTKMQYFHIFIRSGRPPRESQKGLASIKCYSQLNTRVSNVETGLKDALQVLERLEVQQNDILQHIKYKAPRRELVSLNDVVVEEETKTSRQ